MSSYPKIVARHARPLALFERKQTNKHKIATFVAVTYMTRFVKKYAGAYNINKSTRRILSENVKLIILSKENNFTITDNFSALFYRYLELDITIGHFTVAYLVTWPLSGSEAAGDLVLIQTLLLFICKCRLVSMRTT